MLISRRDAARMAAAVTGVGATGAQDRRGTREGRALWAHPEDTGPTAAGVRAFVQRCADAGVETIVILAKGTNGNIYWKSRRFPQAIAKGWEDFDLLEQILPEAHARGMKVHAWVCDFVESANSVVVREHPEWAQLNPGGQTTLSERRDATRGSEHVAMCPARRPGFTDQWLLPMIEEIATHYAVDGIHHDYVRYMGVAPESYCFCDYCLNDMARWALLKWETGPAERLRMEGTSSRVEGNWGGMLDMLPVGWERMDRREKADFLVHGATLPGGPRDMSYFFYEYRVEQINNFVYEAAKRVRRIRPKIEISAATFINPIQCARFIGQKWNDWTPWVDIFMPMTYRNQFRGDFEVYLARLTEVTKRQKEWLRNEKALYAGIATTYLYKEEQERKIYPPEKLTRAIEAARRAGPDGIAIFAAGALTSQKLWDTLAKAFKG
jgi:uncharacterized lipoprotein YddW (UPF0748 family)